MNRQANAAAPTNQAMSQIIQIRSQGANAETAGPAVRNSHADLNIQDFSGKIARI